MILLGRFMFVLCWIIEGVVGTTAIGSLFASFWLPHKHYADEAMKVGDSVLATGITLLVIGAIGFCMMCCQTDLMHRNARAKLKKSKPPKIIVLGRRKPDPLYIEWLQEQAKK